MNKLIENTGVMYPDIWVIESKPVLQQSGKYRKMYVGANGLVRTKRHAIKFPTQQSAEYFRLDMSTMPENYKVVSHGKIH